MRRAMERTLFIKETDTSSENFVISSYESFGWEVIDIQRAVTNHLSSKVKITFARPRNYPQKALIGPLEKEYNDLEEKILANQSEINKIKAKSFDSTKPPEKWGNNMVGVLLLLFFNIVGIIYFLVKFINDEHNKKLLKKYNQEMENFKTEQEAAVIKILDINNTYIARQKQIVELAGELTNIIEEEEYSLN